MQTKFVVSLFYFLDHFFGFGFSCVPRRIWQRLGTSSHRATLGLLLCSGRDAPSVFSIAPRPPPRLQPPLPTPTVL